ncbi:Calvin cycle protein CP12 [Gloeocapsopsis crepidinum LEGE 06123]|uniref:Calvin cycle protein CP12 n=1 Tax=Gloeocapsopsis crepidinum LEGE 06123 TaxID=588587 RepID=A0ABR9URZ1_9CHRO|nr:Calvin cycle protein CP12 [Gloeocapsopsis crepidinum]MBE9191056.1 Calvin cycle protein CP12 [Gloeocapsopsis crepidinum LEGE 06123]
MVYIAEKQLVTTTSISRSESKKSLETSLQAALEHARRLTQMYGIGVTEVAVAWDVVEELATARFRQRENKSSSSAFERYCALHPDAPECRIYDV